MNDASIVLSLSCGGSDALLTGDASSDIEEQVLALAGPIDTDLLKVGHHGSRYSSSVKFLETVKPQWDVISSGAGNTYGHPYPIAVQHLEQS